MKRFFCALLALTLCVFPAGAITGEPSVEVPSALLMEKETGAILYEQSAHDRYEPASVTKIMTMLLVMEAVDSGRISMEDTVQASAHACSMGGSQIYLKEGEQMSVHDLLKSVAVASANDAAVALAEHIAGSESSFVAQMNERAAQLGMKDTTFRNCTGLPDPDHLTSAYDVALMSRELIRHQGIREFTTIWMDSVRDGQFQLANTNKLIRFYDGATGLKTGFTASALFCLSATAERDGMELIAVVLHAPTSEARFETAKSLLTFGFANYTLVDARPGQALPPIEVALGVDPVVQPILQDGGRILVDKTDLDKVTTSVQLTDQVEAPVEKGQKLGSMTVYLDGVEQAVVPIVADEAVERLTLGGVFTRFMGKLFMAG